MHPVRASIAEFIGTFALTFVGGAAIIITAGLDVSLLAVALAHGLILSVMVSATLHISGGQINPAVSIALLLIGKQPLATAAMFIVAQLLGAIIAAFCLGSFFSHGYEVGNLGATLGNLTSGEKPVLGAAFVLEVIATFFLMFVIMGAAVDSRGVSGGRSISGFAIGMTVAANILAIGPLTGASMNPARSFGPALAAGAWDAHWLYWVAPIIGASLAAFAYQLSFLKSKT